MYYINPSREILTVTTSWEDRDEYSIVAVDRLVIVPRRAANLSLLSKLNVSGTKYVFDDLQAEIVAGDYRITLKDEESWDDSYQLIMNPKMKISMVYTFKDCWPIGNYQLYAWMPANKGGISASVKLYSDNTVLLSDTGEEAVSVTAPASQEGSWISIGSWVGITNEIENLNWHLKYPRIQRVSSRLMRSHSFIRPFRNNNSDR